MEIGNPSLMEQGEEYQDGMAQPPPPITEAPENNGSPMKQGDESNSEAMIQPFRPIGEAEKNNPLKQGQESQSEVALQSLTISADSIESEMDLGDEFDGGIMNPIRKGSGNNGPLTQQEYESHVPTPPPQLPIIKEAPESIGPPMEQEDELHDEIPPLTPPRTRSSAIGTPTEPPTLAIIPGRNPFAFDEPPAEASRVNVNALHQILANDLGGPGEVVFIVHRNGVNGLNYRSAFSTHFPIYTGEGAQDDPRAAEPGTSAIAPGTDSAEPDPRQPSGRRSCPRSFNIFY